ncbi:MAG: basic membrane protein A [Polaromonas sp.]
MSAEMQAMVDDASAKIASGELMVHDYMSDESCPAISF